jgi:hypothetical protein
MMVTYTMKYLIGYFDFNLQLAQIPWQSCFMGHSGDIESTYTGKNLQEELTKSIREIFEKAEPRLTTIQHKENKTSYTKQPYDFNPKNWKAYNKP